MITKVYSSALHGVDAVEVEVSARGAEKPLVIIVGLPDAAVRESSQRVTSALGNSSLRWENGVNTINLAAADLKKDGHVTISRAAGSLTFPSRFMLVAAMNPCPYGLPS